MLPARLSAHTHTHTRPAASGTGWVLPYPTVLHFNPLYLFPLRGQVKLLCCLFVDQTDPVTTLNPVTFAH